jgi:hypothetical protein
MFKTDLSYYALMAVRIASILSASVYITLKGESLGAHCLGALLMGCYWQQLAFVGHDLGHNGISHT